MRDVFEAFLSKRTGLESAGPAHRLRDRFGTQNLPALRVSRDARDQVDRGAKQPSFSLDHPAMVDASTNIEEVRLVPDRLAQAQRGPHHRGNIRTRTKDIITDAIDDPDTRLQARLDEPSESEHDLRGMQRAVRFSERRVPAQVGD